MSSIFLGAGARALRITRGSREIRCPFGRVTRKFNRLELSII